MRISIRLSDTDRQAFQKIASHIKNESPSVVLHYCLMVTYEIIKVPPKDAIRHELPEEEIINDIKYVKE
jgi:hypothetical protein